MLLVKLQPIRLEAIEKEDGLLHDARPGQVLGANWAKVALEANMQHWIVGVGELVMAINHRLPEVTVLCGVSLRELEEKRKKWGRWSS